MKSTDPIDFAPGSARPRRHLIKRGLVGVVVASCALACMGLPAIAAPGDTSTGSTTANVDVTTAIALTGLTSAFTLTGLPGATVTASGAVTMTVTTNNLAGYAVTVESAAPVLAATAGSNPDSIPITALGVRETGGTTFTALSSTGTDTVHSQGTRSAEIGDTVSNDYQVVIPFVNEDTYTTTLNYIATTL
jgi:hypothetical protein